MIKAGIVGGAGYTAGEMIRILLNHPETEITFIQSTSNAGNPVSDIHTDLFGVTDLTFDKDLALDKVDVIFLCMGHGKSRSFVEENNIPANVKVIDLSNDFRLNPSNDNFVYGLPEVYREEIKSAKNIANPGCFATCIQLGMVPLAANGLLNEVHVQAITGSTGAGQAPSATTHFSWRDSNVSVYKAFKHQHLGEIRQTFADLQASFEAPINFVPLRGNFTRGILASSYTKCPLTLEEAKELYKEYYKNHPFVFVSDKNPDMKQVVNSNRCLVYLEKHDENLLVISIIDNLAKGASGQAVQNMNLMFGLDESTGLQLKTAGF